MRWVKVARPAAGEVVLHPTISFPALARLKSADAVPQSMLEMVYPPAGRYVVQDGEADAGARVESGRPAGFRAGNDDTQVVDRGDLAVAERQALPSVHGYCICPWLLGSPPRNARPQCRRRLRSSLRAGLMIGH